MSLRTWEIHVLEAIDEEHSFTAAHIGGRVWRSSTPRQAAGSATPALKSLRDMGLAKLMDGLRPMVWLRTPAGSAEVERRERLLREA